MSTKKILHKKMELPTACSFSFKDYLQNIGLEKKERIEQENNAFNLMDLLEKSHAIFFSEFEIELGEVKRIQEKKELKENNGFPIDQYIISYVFSDQVEYRIVLDRLYNGHLGCYEDEVKAVFKFQEKVITLTTSLFLNNKLDFYGENFTKERFEKLFIQIETFANSTQ